MGQYYNPVILTEDQKPIGFFYSHDFGSGLKLMEHSWLKNPFVRYVEKFLEAQPSKIVWAGDYADREPDTEKNLYELSEAAIKLTHDEAPKENIWDHKFKTKYYRYLVNLDTFEYVDKNKIPENAGWKIHPLPLLTCEGNGRGGGDFRGDSNLIGLWARNRITVSNKKPKGYDELIFDLVE